MAHILCSIGAEGNEVGHDLGFDGGTGSVSDALPHQLQGPFSNPSLCFRALDYLFEWVFRNHYDWMRIEIVLELPFGDQHGVDELLDLRVAGIEIGKYLANKIDGPLHFQHFVGLVTLDH
jgi:hypothetical protein